MTGKGHHYVGALSGVCLLPWVDAPGAPFTVLLSAWLGGTAPDWLELPYLGRRVIPHRRITHWVLAWLAALLLSLGLTHEWKGVAIGFCIGGISHLLVDYPNPMGIPVVHPWERTSLNLWKSGSNELFIKLFFFFMAGLSLSVGSTVNH